MRSIWRGAVSFGLVSIGVKLYSATEDKDIRFHQVHATDGGRVKYKRVCSIDGEEVEYSDIAKGYELPDGQVVILTDEDFDELPLSTRREIEVLRVRRPGRDRPDPCSRRPTTSSPTARRPGPYVLLRDALENAGQVAITKIAIRQRESLAALRVRDGVLVLHTMRWPDEIRRPDFGFLDEDITRPAAGTEDGRGADRLDDRRVRPERVHRRLPRGDDRAARGQAERRRGAAGARGAPTTAPPSST